MTNNTRSATEIQLFDLLYQGRDSEARQLLDSLVVKATKESSLQRDIEPELSLPLTVALQGFDEWSARQNILCLADRVCSFSERVIHTVPYYRNRSQSLNETRETSLDRFPLMTKTEMANSFSQFVSDEYVASDFKFFKCTSGSTGDPLIVWYDLASFYDLAYVTYGTVAQLLPGVLDAVKVGGLGAVQITDDPITWPASTVLPSLKLAQLRRRLIGSDEEANVRQIQELRGEKIPILCGLATSVARLAEIDASVAEPLGRISPVAIFVSGENLFEDRRRVIEEWFRCRVYNAYASSEGGFIAMECSQRRGLHVHGQRVVLEILRPSGQIATEGSGIIVLTNLMNWAIPFVRYKTDDYATIRYIECPCGYIGQTITDLPGRQATYFRTGSSIFDPNMLDEELSRLPIKEFQMTQNVESQITVKWVPNAGCNDYLRVEEAIAQRLRREGVIAVQFQRVARTTEPGQKIKRYLREAP